MGLPNDWVESNLGEVAQYINGRAFKPSEWEKSGLPIIRIENLNNPDAQYNYSSQQFEAKYFVQSGDLLFAWAASLGAFIWRGDNAWLNQHIFKIIPHSCVDKLYLYYYLCNVVSNLYAKTHGSGMVHITKKPFLSTKIPLPPLAEQHRIVAKIEELFAELDRGIASLEKAKAQLKTYRQAVLKSAFEGKLSHISIESKISIEKIASVSTGTTPSTTNSEYYTKGTIPWVASGALNKTFVTSPTSYVTDKALRETRLKIFPKHTLLVALYGEGKTRGKCSELLIDATINQAIAAINLNEDSKVIRPYLKWFLIKNYQDIRLKSKGGVQPNLNLSKIKKIELPICEIEQQQQIVSAIESRLSISDSLEKSIDSSLKNADLLRMSILKKAFAGELVGQDPAETSSPTLSKENT